MGQLGEDVGFHFYILSSKILSSASRAVREASDYSGSVMVQKVAVKREFETGLRHATTGKLSLSTQQ